MGLSPAYICPSVCLSVNLFLLSHLLKDHWADVFESLPECYRNVIVVLIGFTVFKSLLFFFKTSSFRLCYLVSVALLLNN